MSTLKGGVEYVHVRYSHPQWGPSEVVLRAILPDTECLYGGTCLVGINVTPGGLQIPLELSNIMKRHRQAQ